MNALIFPWPESRYFYGEAPPHLLFFSFMLSNPHLLITSPRLWCTFNDIKHAVNSKSGFSGE